MRRGGHYRAPRDHTAPARWRVTARASLAPRMYRTLTAAGCSARTASMSLTIVSSFTSQPARRLPWPRSARPARPRSAPRLTIASAHFRARPPSNAGVGHGTNSPAGRLCRSPRPLRPPVPRWMGPKIRLPRAECCAGHWSPTKVSVHNPITGLSQRSPRRLRPSVERSRGDGRATRGAGEPRTTSPGNKGAMSTKREVTPEPANAQSSPLASGSVRFGSRASVQRRGRLAAARSRSCSSPSLARSHSCSCSSPRSPGRAARRAGPSGCSARSPMTAPGAAVPVANRSRGASYRKATHLLA